MITRKEIPKVMIGDCEKKRKKIFRVILSVLMDVMNFDDERRILLYVFPPILVVAFVHMIQKNFSSLLAVSKKSFIKTRRLTIRALDPHLYLSWTFCLMSAKFSLVMSRSRYSLNFSVADSKSFWLSSNIIDWLFFFK